MRPGGGRQKGASFEREIAGMLEAELGIKFKRDIEQYRQSTRGDLIPVDASFPFSIECKRYADGRYARPEWWEQSCAAAKAAGLMPALIYRFDRSPIVVRIPVQAFVVMADGSGDYGWQYHADMTFEAFCMVAREML